MNKNEYISALRSQLRRLPSNDVDEIVKEFEAHFDMGIADGKTEFEIAQKLGAPEEVAQYYLSDEVPQFEVKNDGNGTSAGFPIIPVKTGWVINRGVGPQTAAGFANGQYARPVNNQPPKPEPSDAPNAHVGAKAKETYEKVGPQGQKNIPLPPYPEYPSQNPGRVTKQPKDCHILFAWLFTIFVFIPVWILALALVLLLIAAPIGLGVLCVGLFTWVPGMSVGVGGTVCLAIASAFAAIGAAFVAFFALKGFVLGTIAYIRYIASGCKSKGGNV